MGPMTCRGQAPEVWAWSVRICHVGSRGHGPGLVGVTLPAGPGHLCPCSWAPPGPDPCSVSLPTARSFVCIVFNSLCRSHDALPSTARPRGPRVLGLHTLQGQGAAATCRAAGPREIPPLGLSYNPRAPSRIVIKSPLLNIICEKKTYRSLGKLSGCMYSPRVLNPPRC